MTFKATLGLIYFVRRVRADSNTAEMEILPRSNTNNKDIGKTDGFNITSEQTGDAPLQANTLIRSDATELVALANKCDPLSIYTLKKYLSKAGGGGEHIKEIVSKLYKAS